MADTGHVLSIEPPWYALSIRQPWAWLIANGIKRIENRKWSTSFRGPFFVHAGKGFDHQAYEWITKTMSFEIPEPKSYALGGIVGKAEIIDCVKQHPSKWFFGPYGFVLTDASPLPFIPLKGQLGFFMVLPEDLLQRHNTSP